MRYNDEQIKAFNDALDNATTFEQGAKYLATLTAAALRAVCKSRDLDQGGGPAECAKRILAARFDTGTGRPRRAVAPAFTPPSQRVPSREPRRTADTNHAGRYAFLDRIGRRCDAYGRTCHTNRATRRLVVQPLNPDGQPEGEQQTVLSCSRHVNWYRYSGKYTLVSEDTLPPVDPALEHGKSTSTRRT